MISSTRIPLNVSPRIFPLVRAAACTYRLIMDEIVSHKKEQERGHVASSIECYQAETGASEEEAVEYFSKQVEDAWKVINRESLRPTGFPFPLVMPEINLARVIDTTYKGNDGLTRAGKDVINFIKSLFVHPMKEQERGHVASSIECYQAETGASEEEAVEYFSKQVEDAWKVINRESLRPTGFPFLLVMPAINLARVIDTTYKGNDGVTRAGKDVINFIKSLFVHPMVV
nr:E-beta-farnesene synthase 1 [Tanacetum cinerariifolium]